MGMNTILTLIVGIVMTTMVGTQVAPSIIDQIKVKKTQTQTINNQEVIFEAIKRYTTIKQVAPTSIAQLISANYIDTKVNDNGFGGKYTINVDKALGVATITTTIADPKAQEAFLNSFTGTSKPTKVDTNKFETKFVLPNEVMHGNALLMTGIPIQATPPDSNTNKYWYDTSSGKAILKLYSGASWIEVKLGGSGEDEGVYVKLTGNQTIGGIKTFTSNIVGNVTGNLSGNVSGNVTGNLFGNATSATNATNAVNATNAANATKLSTPRQINGVNFDGSSNITITSVANSTNATNATNSTKLATPRQINGVNFDGSSNITIHDNTKVALSGNQTIADIKTFTSSPKAPTPVASDNSTNLATTQFVKNLINSGDFTQSLTPNGYVKFPNGLIIQWGIDRNYDATYSLSPYTINFPIAFPNACFLVNGNTQTSYTGPAASVYFAISSWNKTSFTRPGYIGRLTWIAIGY